MFTNRSTAAADTIYVRYLLLEIKAGGGYSNTDVQNNFLEPYGTTATVDTSLTGQLSDIFAHTNRESFRVVTDGTVQLGPQTTTLTSATPHSKTMKLSVPYKRQWRYQDSDAGDPIQNRLLWVAFARSSSSPMTTSVIHMSTVLAMDYHSAN